MKHPLPTPSAPLEPHAVLGVSPDATPEELRSAYLEAVARWPPDTAPEEFQRVRAAYELLKDPQQRFLRALAQDEGHQPMVSLLEGHGTKPRFVGPRPWLAVLKRRGGGG